MPCRKETPFLKMAKERYKDKLAIYAVTIDADTLKWEKAIEEDKMCIRDRRKTAPNTSSM